MIQVTAQTRVLVSVEPIDFRAGIDRLCRICQAQLSNDPFSGTLYVFRNRQATAIKILAYDGQGFWLCQKRLSSGRFRYWPTQAGSGQHPLLAHELHVLLMAGDPEATGAAPQWRPVQSPSPEGRDTLSPD
ncbi:MAG TPA: IS66 family insertion sequence element accessory protein TnpB [Polyangiales bacterium]|nr:IS66 family insertion sequence element accessory protein TnpB [Polyangiales bacterium]